MRLHHRDLCELGGDFSDVDGLVSNYVVGAKYLRPYVNEFQFGYNNHTNADIFRAVIRAY